MTPHKQLALDFAREVIGWRTAQFTDDENRIGVAIGPVRIWKDDVFHPDDLADVLKWSESWCDEQDRFFKLTYMGGKFGACVGGFDAFSDDPKVALMEAALLAERDRAQGRVCQP